MPKAKCRECGKTFEYTWGAVNCPECEVRIRRIFKDVKNYLWDNPGASEAIVCEKFGISRHVINDWLRNDKIQLSENSDIVLRCEKCGAEILSGHYCSKCQKEVDGTSVHGTFMGKEEKAEMRYLDRKK